MGFVALRAYENSEVGGADKSSREVVLSHAGENGAHAENQKK